MTSASGSHTETRRTQSWCRRYDWIDTNPLYVGDRKFIYAICGVKHANFPHWIKFGIIARAGVCLRRKHGRKGLRKPENGRRGNICIRRKTIFAGGIYPHEVLGQPRSHPSVEAWKGEREPTLSVGSRSWRVGPPRGFAPWREPGRLVAHSGALPQSRRARSQVALSDGGWFLSRSGR